MLAKNQLLGQKEDLCATLPERQAKGNAYIECHEYFQANATNTASFEQSRQNQQHNQVAQQASLGQRD